MKNMFFVLVGCMLAQTSMSQDVDAVAIGLAPEVGCTVFHLGDGVAVTAGHCVDAPTDYRYDRPCPRDFTIEWGVTEGYVSGQVSQCVRILGAERNSDADYAIILVYPHPSATLAMAEEESRPDMSLPVTLAGHPNRNPLTITEPCYLGPASKAQMGRYMFSHDCETEGGFSGSPVIDENGTVVGIHGGSTGSGFRYGTYISDTKASEFLYRAGRKEIQPHAYDSIPWEYRN